MAVEIQVRRGAASVWTSVNPTLAQGEWGLETDTQYMKIGNGASVWTQLPYQIQGFNGGGGSVSSVFGRTGAIAASVTDYSVYYDANGQASAASTAAITTSEAYAFSITHAASVSLAASIAAGGGGASAGVSSFNGRSGVVVPAITDYNAASVGALSVFNVKDPLYGAAGNGTTNDQPAIQSAINAAASVGGIVFLPPGAYKITSGLTCSTSTLPYYPVYIQGAGKWATQINAAWSTNGASTATVDALRMYNSNIATASVYGGGITGLTIDGTSVSGTYASGLHIGDLFNAQVDIAVQNFTTAHSVGCWFDNYYCFTEQMAARVYASNNTTNVAFDNSSPNTITYAGSAGSFDRGVYDIFINQGTSASFDGVVFRNGAYLQDGRLGIYGNFGTGASLSSAVLRITGSTPSNHSGAGGASEIANSVVNIGVETDGISGTGPHTLVCDNGAATAILSCSGIMDFSAGLPFAAASNPNLAFWGPIFGDATLSGLWNGTTGNGLASYFTANGTSAVTVTNYWVSSSSQIIIQLETPGGTPGHPYVSSISAGTSITFESQAGDSSTYSFRLLS